MATSSPDPVAAKSSFLCMYMSNHPDTLVAYVRHFGHIKEKVLSAKMEKIDTKGMDLSYKTKDGKGKEVRVVFDPLLAGYEEVKPRLLAMTADAQEALGMSKAPQITTFSLPFRAFLTTGPLLLFFTYVSLSPYVSASPTHPAPPSLLPSFLTATLSPLWDPAVAFLKDAVPSAGWDLGNWLFAASGGRDSVARIWLWALLAHSVESVYVAHLAAKHRMPFFVGMQYTLSTLALGFPTIFALRKRIQRARIDSIMKGN